MEIIKNNHKNNGNNKPFSDGYSRQYYYHISRTRLPAHVLTCSGPAVTVWLPTVLHDPTDTEVQTSLSAFLKLEAHDSHVIIKISAKIIPIK